MPLLHWVSWSLPNTVTGARGFSWCQSPEVACGDVEGKMWVFALHAIWRSIQAALNFTKISRFFLLSLSHCMQGTELETDHSSASMPNTGSQAPAWLSSDSSSSSLNPVFLGSVASREAPEFSWHTDFLSGHLIRPAFVLAVGKPQLRAFPGSSWALRCESPEDLLRMWEGQNLPPISHPLFGFAPLPPLFHLSAGVLILLHWPLGSHFCCYG